MLADLDNARTRQRLDGQKEILHAAAFVFVIVARENFGLGRQGLSGFSDQLPGGLVHAHHRVPRIVGPLANLQHPTPIRATNSPFCLGGITTVAFSTASTRFS